ncbi:Epstein-Barr virus EBNA-1-like protein [Rhynchospora pubera]|uniref:Epstein-Barr virus EBNA-1-like protein n=1 Tax=Rhynchospora pubera TaxID=906938 RepID=A0AAV8FI42_9POAL|nr:Epstein-Barr virus EBNA-1-like protein [Rhynchospora pubera]
MMTKALSPPQRTQIMELGFEPILTLRPMLISRQLIVSITMQDVWCIMGLRDEVIKIDIDRRVPKDELIRIFKDPSQEQITFNSLMDHILHTDPCNPNFIHMFIIFLVAGVLAPPQSEVILYEYLNMVDDIPLISKITWSNFTIKILLCGLKRNVVDKGRLQGSLIFIQLFYLEQVQMADGDEGIHCHSLMANVCRKKKIIVVRKIDSVVK